MSTSSRPPGGGGAGPAGGLLFLAVMLFVGYLAITAVAGILRLIIGLALLIVLAMLAVRVLRRP